MGKLYKVLGQLVPAVNNDEIVYTTPALTNSVISTITVTSLEATITASYRIAIVPSGQTLAAKHYIRYDKLIEAKDNASITLGVTIAAGDRVYIRSTSANVAFGVFGVEIT
jgi:hypothetical protein